MTSSKSKNPRQTGEGYLRVFLTDNSTRKAKSMANSSYPTWRALLQVGLAVTLWITTNDMTFLRQAFAQGTDSRPDTRAMLMESRRLKMMLGFEDTTSIKDIEAAFKTDMAAHGAALAPGFRTYREVMKSLAAEIENLENVRDDLEKQVQTTREQLGKAFEQSRRKHPDSGANRAIQDLAKEREAFDRDRKRLMDENAKLLEKWQEERKQLEAQLQQHAETTTRLRGVLSKHGIEPKEATAGGIQPRMWTDTSGQFSVKAELVELKDGKAMLRRADGKVITVPVDSLSRSDRDYLSTLDNTTQ